MRKGVLEARKTYMDMLNVQYFCESIPEYREKMVQELDEWQKLCGKPVLVADIRNWGATEMNTQRKSALGRAKGEKEGL